MLSWLSMRPLRLPIRDSLMIQLNLSANPAYQLPVRQILAIVATNSTASLRCLRRPKSSGKVHKINRQSTQANRQIVISPSSFFCAAIKIKFENEDATKAVFFRRFVVYRYADVNLNGKDERTKEKLANSFAYFGARQKFDFVILSFPELIYTFAFANDWQAIKRN